MKTNGLGSIVTSFYWKSMNEPRNYLFTSSPHNFRGSYKDTFAIAYNGAATMIGDNQNAYMQRPALPSIN